LFVYNATQVSITVEIVNKYRIMAVLKVETDINTSNSTSISASPKF